MRRGFYLTIALAFPLFFLLHWNGLLDLTYRWMLTRAGTTDSARAQAGAALISSLVIFGAIVAVFELIARLRRKTG